MEGAAPESSTTKIGNLGFMRHAIHRRHDFFHLFLMGGVLLLSMKTASQKYRINDLQDDKKSLLEENQSLKTNLSNLKATLLQELPLATNPALVSKLRALLSDPVS